MGVGPAQAVPRPRGGGHPLPTLPHPALRGLARLRPLYATPPSSWRPCPCERCALPAGRHAVTHLDALRAGWRDAALSPDGGAAAIHPSGADPEDYEASGRRDAMDVLTVIGAEPDWRVMEFGCGNGRVTRPLAGAWETLFAVDAVPQMTAQVAALGLANVTPALWDGLTPWPDDLGGLDGVFSHATLIHNTVRDGQAILANLAAACRPGATLAVQVPVYE